MVFSLSDEIRGAMPHCNAATSSGPEALLRGALEGQGPGRERGGRGLGEGGLHGLAAPRPALRSVKPALWGNELSQRGGGEGASSLILAVPSLLFYFWVLKNILSDRWQLHQMI